MKRNLLILILSLWLVQANSQTLHFNLGASLSKLDWTYFYEAGTEQQYDDPLLSYAFAAGIEFWEHEYYSVSSDLSLYKSGGKYSEEETNMNFVFVSPGEISVTYLSIGGSFNFNPINEKIKLQLSLGPRIDYIIGGAKDSPYDWIDKADGLNKFNFGITGGVGLYYNVKAYVFGINGQYLQRFKKLAEVEGSYNPGLSTGGVDASEKVMIVGFSVGYRLNY